MREYGDSSSEEAVYVDAMRQWLPVDKNWLITLNSNDSQTTYKVDTGADTVANFKIQAPTGEWGKHPDSVQWTPYSSDGQMPAQSDTQERKD